MSNTVTEGVRIRVVPHFHPERSSFDRFIFSYTVEICNEGESAVQLVSRHWTITDANGQVDQVNGPGVVGETPRLEHMQCFRYTSFCPLPTSLGAMQGSFQMVREDGTTFDAEIEPFVLADPAQMN